MGERRPQAFSSQPNEKQKLMFPRTLEHKQPENKQNKKVKRRFEIGISTFAFPPTHRVELHRVEENRMFEIKLIFIYKMRMNNDKYKQSVSSCVQLASLASGYRHCSSLSANKCLRQTLFAL